MAKKKKKESTSIATSIIDDLVKASGNEYASKASTGTLSNVHSYLDTGVFLLNAQYSGDFYKGLPAGKTHLFAGKPSTGKSFYVMSIGANFLKTEKDGILIYIDAENAVDQVTFEERGMDTSRIMYMPVDTVENFRTQLLCVINKINEQDEAKVCLIIDGLVSMTSDKELTDIEKGDTKIDMTRQKLLQGTFRVLNLKLAKHSISTLVTTKTYQSMGSFIQVDVVSGGSGAQYAASSITMLTKAQDKTNGNVTGVRITSKLDKSRFTKEKTKVKTLLSFTKGLHPYSGLPDFALDVGYWSKSGTKIQLQNGDTAFEKTIMRNPKKYFTKEVMDDLNQKAKEYFGYGDDSWETPENKETDNEDIDNES